MTSVKRTGRCARVASRRAVSGSCKRDRRREEGRARNSENRHFERGALARKSDSFSGSWRPLNDPPSEKADCGLPFRTAPECPGKTFPGSAHGQAGNPRHATKTVFCPPGEGAVCGRKPGIDGARVCVSAGDGTSATGKVVVRTARALCDQTGKLDIDPMELGLMAQREPGEGPCDLRQEPRRPGARPRNARPARRARSKNLRPLNRSAKASALGSEGRDVALKCHGLVPAQD